MNSIIHENKFLRCPNCSNLIASFAPACSECGLIIGEDELNELAETYAVNRKALDSANGLYALSWVPGGFLLVGCLVSYWMPEAVVSVTFIASIAIGMFWWKFIRWHREFSEWESRDEQYDEALQTRNIAGVLNLIMIIFAGLIAYLTVF